MKFNEIKVNLRKFQKKNLKKINETTIRFIENTNEKFENSIPYIDVGIENVENRGCKWREVYSVKLNRSLNFVPGDSVGILVPNDKNLIDSLFSICKIEEKYVEIERLGRNGFVYTGSLYRFFLNYFDLKTLPKKSFIYALSKVSTCPEILEYLCSIEGELDYLKMSNNQNNLIDIIGSFNCRPSLEMLIENCEIIKPRFFSLTNNICHKLEILVGIIPGGHVSGFIKRQDYTVSIKCYIKQNNLMRLTPVKNILCICTGTGIAPFYSFSENKLATQSLWLVFGCRDIEDDLSRGIMAQNNVVVDKTFSSKGEYISKILESKKEHIGEFLKEGNLFVCGSMKMQEDVFKFFKNNFACYLDQKAFFDNWK